MGNAGHKGSRDSTGRGVIRCLAQENLTSHLIGKQTRAGKARQFTLGHYQGVFLLSKPTCLCSKVLVRKKKDFQEVRSLVGTMTTYRALSSPTV